MAEEANDFFELIDLSSGNVVGDFDDYEAALAAIRLVAAVHGLGAVERLSLMYIQGDEQSVVAMDGELIARLKGDEPTREGAVATGARGDTQAS